jgi:hypothetical protein
VKTRCCRSTPRCAACPVLMIAARRRQAGMPDLFAEILGGRAARTLPESVVRALAELERRPERTGPPGRFARTRAADPAYSGVAGVAVAGASCSPDEPELVLAASAAAPPANHANAASARTASAMAAADISRGAVRVE